MHSVEHIATRWKQKNEKKYSLMGRVTGAFVRQLELVSQSRNFILHSVYFSSTAGKRPVCL